MASLITHFGITKILMEKYNLGEEVLLGAILPDILKLSKLSTWRESHNIQENNKLPDIEKYINMHHLKNEIDLVDLGYLLHLIQDYIWYKYLDKVESKLDEDHDSFKNKIYSDMNIGDKYVLQKLNIDKKEFGKIKFDIKSLSNNKKIQQYIEELFYIRKIENRDIYFITIDVLKKYIRKSLETCEKYLCDLL